MPRTHFEPGGLGELGQVFAVAKTILQSRGRGTPEELDFVASLIFSLAADGIGAEFILAEIVRTLPTADGEPVPDIPGPISEGAISKGPLAFWLGNGEPKVANANAAAPGSAPGLPPTMGTFRAR